MRIESFLSKSHRQILLQYPHACWLKTLLSCPSAIKETRAKMYCPKSTYTFLSLSQIRVNVVRWSEDLYEEQLVERTKDACGGLVDIVIDFSANSRSIRRGLKCLTKVRASPCMGQLWMSE